MASQTTPKPVFKSNVGPQWSLNSVVCARHARKPAVCRLAHRRARAPVQSGRLPLPEPWDAPSYILQREEAPVTPRQHDIHHVFTTATSADREHAAQQTRDQLVKQRRQEAADRVLRYAVNDDQYKHESRSATKQSLDTQRAQACARSCT